LKKSSFDYMGLVREKLRNDLPEISTYFQTGGLVDAVVNLGLPTPIDIQVGGNNMQEAFATATKLAGNIKKLDGVSDVLIPQDLDYPGLQLDVNREMAGRLGLNSSEIVDNVITALTSNGMIAPSYYVDPKTGNNYLLTVRFPETQVKSMTDFRQIPVRSHDGA
jgi:HAE1 family hydrophobic/amphiphilic exporter-1